MNTRDRSKNKQYNNKLDKGGGGIQQDKGEKKDEYIDFIKNRLCIHEREVINLEGYCVKVNCLLKQVCEDELSCWTELSSLVKCKKSIGFPMLRGTKCFSYSKMLYFEQFKNTKVERLSPHVPCLPENILFQVAIILYTMHKKNIYVDEFCFDLVTIPKTTFIFSVNQLMFQICTTTLVVLSISTRPYRVELPQSCYLNYLHSFNTISRKSYDTSNYFFEWLLKNHLDFLTKQSIDIFKVKKKYISGNHINKSTEPGTLVLIPKEDVYFMGITLTYVSINDNVRIIYSLDGGNILEIDDFNILDVFYSGELIVRSQTCAILI
ncbi:Internal virion protein [Eptesipox virus]|uniref:Internal virion protein n=1 Tax=Eptesipox virus TaxID=1329402 RepID=A0A220T6D0_9POXV|nr:Internal virion protein [Eptesipox virus]ASK51267.1 Internal virion protein [Eptesipox virus]WAH71025.1 internal virion protein [Eptesipox virus]